LEPRVIPREPFKYLYIIFYSSSFSSCIVISLGSYHGVWWTGSLIRL
jgi:hypothetical protein